MEMLDQSVIGAAKSIADRWRPEQAERQARRNLDRADFAALSEGRLWATVCQRRWAGCGAMRRPRCVRCATRCADRRRGFVGGAGAAMHPSVIAFWLANPSPEDDDWISQRDAVFASAAAGEQWGTITSEPGSGGDIAPNPGRRHTGRRCSTSSRAPLRSPATSTSGAASGVTDRMMTTAVPEGETDPTIFVLDVPRPAVGRQRGLHPDRRVGRHGHGRDPEPRDAARRRPAVRLAWNGQLDAIIRAAGPFVADAVHRGDPRRARRGDRTVAGAAAPRRPSDLRAYEQVEWAARGAGPLGRGAGVRRRAAGDRGRRSGRALHAALRGQGGGRRARRGALRRLTRVLGGGTFSRRSPFAHWFEDVRALGSSGRRGASPTTACSPRRSSPGLASTSNRTDNRCGRFYVGGRELAWVSRAFTHGDS